jgi:predicted nucleotidyltransferase
MDSSLDRLKGKILPILRRNGVARAGIFGSYARGRPKKGSDIDLLVDFGERKSLFDLAGLKLDLEEKTNQKFDVLTYNSLNYLLKDQILKEEVRIL